MCPDGFWSPLWGYLNGVWKRSACCLDGEYHERCLVWKVEMYCFMEYLGRFNSLPYLLTILPPEINWTLLLHCGCYMSNTWTFTILNTQKQSFYFSLCQHSQRISMRSNLTASHTSCFEYCIPANNITFFIIGFGCVTPDFVSSAKLQLQLQFRVR